MSYDEDDLVDYANEDYDDEISPEDEEKINSLVPKLKSQLQDYSGFTYDDMFNELYDCYMDVDEAAKSMKKKFKKVVKSKPKPKVSAKVKEAFEKPSRDDTVLESQKQASNGAKESVNSLKENFQKLNLKPTKPKKTVDVEKMGSSKPTLSFAVIGHVDAGKSTLMGMFLKSLNKVNKAFLKRLEEESAKQGKKSFALAWIMDQTAEERKRGVTVDICTTAVNTNSANFIVIDAPGHKDFVPRMVAGVSQADIALLIVDAGTNAFEAGFSYDGQTKEHALISYSLGMKKLVIVMNKMDSVDYSQERFEDIKSQLESFLTADVGYSKEQLVFLPVSAFQGVNIKDKPTEPELVKWYPNSEPTLLEVLENEAKSLKIPQDIDKEEFVFQISEVYTDSHQASEFSLVGRVNSGTIQPGESVIVFPGEISLQIESIKVSESVQGKEIEVFKEKEYAVKYDNNVHLFFKDKKIKEELKSNYDLVRSGDLAWKIDGSTKSIESVVKFDCDVQLFDLRGSVFLPGTKLLVHSGGQERQVEVGKIVCLLDKRGQAKKKKALHVGSNKRAIFEFNLIESGGKPRAIPLMKFKDDERLGRVVLRRNGITVGAGRVV